jgi:hypothetical protein
MTPAIFALIMTLMNAHEVTVGRYFEPRNCATARDAILAASPQVPKTEYSTIECRRIEFDDVIYEK